MSDDDRRPAPDHRAARHKRQRPPIVPAVVQERKLHARAQAHDPHQQPVR
jgi:hypothetical protein